MYKKDDDNDLVEYNKEIISEYLNKKSVEKISDFEEYLKNPEKTRWLPEIA